MEQQHPFESGSFNQRMSPMWNLFVVVVFCGALSDAYRYSFIVENDYLFSKCVNQPENVLDVYGLADRSETSFATEDDTIVVSGNATFVWDIEPGDRVQTDFYMERFDRGSWMPTPFAMNVYNICAVLFDEKQYWYKLWTKHVLNMDAVRDKCFYPGVKHIYEPFNIILDFDAIGLPLSGRHKLGGKFQAFDALGNPRKTIICVEIRGEMERK